MSNREALERLAARCGLTRPLIEHHGKGRGYTLKAWDYTAKDLFGDNGGWITVGQYPSLSIAEDQIPSSIQRAIKNYPGIVQKQENAS